MQQSAVSVPLMALMLLAAALTVSGVESTGKCAKGPGYWCQSIEHANECNAFDHCLQTVWSTHKSFLMSDKATRGDDDMSKLSDNCKICVECLDGESTVCPYSGLFQAQIERLLKQKISKKAVCQLLDQCTGGDLAPVASASDDTAADETKIDGLVEDKRFSCGVHPRNWCHTVDTALRCDAFNYCMINWAKSSVKYAAKSFGDAPLPADERELKDTCDYCMNIFNKLQDVLDQNATEEHIKDYLDGACRVLPTAKLVDRCLRTVDTRLPVIYNLVRSNVDPGIICRVLKACSDAFLEPVARSTGSLLTDEQQKMAHQVIDSLKTIRVKSISAATTAGSDLVPKLSKTMGVGCELCTIVLSAAKALVENKVEQEKVLGFIETQLCARLGSLNATCIEYVKVEGANIIDMLEHSVDPALVCRGMGLCLSVQVSKTALANKFFDLNVRNIGNCTQCRQVVLSVRAMLSDKKSQALIIKYVNANLCTLAGKSQEMCKMMVDAYAPVFFAMIVSDINDTQICTMIGMCDAKCLAQMAEKQRNHKSSIQHYHDESDKKAVNANCILCEFALNLLERVVSENQTEEEVFKMFDWVCREMPTSVRNECVAFVHAYGPLVAALVAKQIEPSKVCSYIGLCPACDHMKEQSAAVRRSKDKEASCVVCQFTVTYLLDETNFVEKERLVEYSLNNVCKLTPRKYRAKCDSLVANYGNKLVALMEEYSEPGTVCQLVDMCPSADDKVESVDMTDLQPSVPLRAQESKIHHEIHRPAARLLGADDGDVQRAMNVQAKNESLECSLCIYVAELADNMLKENKTAKQIIAELELICNLFPTEMKTECTSFIDEYGPYVLQLLATDLDPKQSCSYLKLCDPALSSTNLKQKQPQPPKPQEKKKNISYLSAMSRFFRH